tara:strand:+ start:506 stop:802 length:297 start_codon:yes stop_codon:yes gene_type:complete
MLMPRGNRGDGRVTDKGNGRQVIPHVRASRSMGEPSSTLSKLASVIGTPALCARIVEYGTGKFGPHADLTSKSTGSKINREQIGTHRIWGKTHIIPLS